MEPVPLIPKPQFLPNIDTVPLLRELFQDEFQTVVPSQKVSENIVTSFRGEKKTPDEITTGKCLEFRDNLGKRKDRLKDYAENVLEAYKNYQKNLCDIRNAEKHLSETHVNYLKREVTIFEDRRVQDLLSLKRYPLFQALCENYVEKYKLLQGDAGLPPKFAATSDFRVMNFKNWRRNLDKLNPTSLNNNCTGNDSRVESGGMRKVAKKLPQEPCRKPRKPRPKKEKISINNVQVFKATPKMVFFNNFKVGEVYKTNIEVKNIYFKATRFTVKAMNPAGPFKVLLEEKPKLSLSPGLTFLISVEFKPKSLDNAAEDVIILAEDGNRLLIPIVAFLEPPVLKTHEELDEFTKVTAERISSSYIECGECFTGDSKVTKVRFRSFGDSGEFFIMSSDNWIRNYVNSVTTDNMLEIPPFRVYPVYFKMKKGEVIDLFVEFLPESSGTHVEKITIACDNGEIATLDLLADAIGWHSYFFTFQDSLLKELSVNEDDDLKVKYYLDFEDMLPNGKAEKVFYVCNNSNMSFEYQWKIREANICSDGEEYLRIPRYQVKIDPESGTFEGNKVLEFLVTINLNNVDLGAYRMVLSLYVLNLPYQCIEEDNTVIQPTGLVRNLYSQSLYGEEECTPELLSLQGTYETLQESIKSYVECQNKTQAAPKNDFCRNVCSVNPGLCAKPLKKSKTFFNIGDNIDDEKMTCVCRPRPAETESLSESCHSRDKSHEDTPPQKNEVTWDFVDVLVDEIELWVEVVPPRVSVEPSVLALSSSLQVNGPPVVRNLVLTNHNRSPLKCFWLSSVKNSNQDKLKENEKANEEAKFIFPSSKTKSLGPEDDTMEVEETKEISEPYQIFIEPQYDFTIPALSEFTCTITILVHRAGKIEDAIILSEINDDLEIKIPILGNAVLKNFEISPEILGDFLQKHWVV